VVSVDERINTYRKRKIKIDTGHQNGIRGGKYVFGVPLWGFPLDIFKKGGEVRTLGVYGIVQRIVFWFVEYAF